MCFHICDAVFVSFSAVQFYIDLPLFAGSERSSLPSRDEYSQGSLLLGIVARTTPKMPLKSLLWFVSMPAAIESPTS